MKIEVVGFDEFKSTTLVGLIQQKRILIKYLLSKVRARDYHAVCDAANDIREIEAQQKLLNRIEASVVTETGWKS